MAVKGAGSLAKLKLTSTSKLPSPVAPVIKGPGVPKLATAGAQKTPTLESLTVSARRGLTPKLALAKAAAGGNSSSKRNPNYPTP